MLFNSFEFIFVFLPVTLLGTALTMRLLGRNVALIWLTACSLFYYGWFDYRYVALIAGSIWFNFLVGRIISRRAVLGRAQPARRWFLFGVATNLALIGYYKYAGFFTATLSGLLEAGWPTPQIILPIGISFFTFQQIAYLADCMRQPRTEERPLDYALFVLFFPQLIAGPIIHHGEIIPQLRDPQTFRMRAEVLADGLATFLLGLGKKVLLADQFGQWASEGFAAAAAGKDLSSLEAWSAALCYTFQIYFDFSGYSDMAIGLGRCVGLELPLNFNSPYKATSIIDFWRRWHITLSHFLRDYLYIPLGGSRAGKARRWANLMLTMLLGGLWHGAGWTYVFWGGLHGAYLVVNHAWRALRGPAPVEDGLWRWIGRAGGWSLTFLSVVVAWVFFRAENFASAVSVLRGMIGLNGTTVPTAIYRLLPEPLRVDWLSHSGKVAYLARGSLSELLELMLFMAVGAGVCLFGRHLHQISWRSRLWLLVPAAALTLQRVLVSRQPSEFLYFQF